MNQLAALILTALFGVLSFAHSSAQALVSPAEQSIAQGNRLIEKDPKNFEAYNALALALSRRARETSNVNYYAQAEEALKKSLRSRRTTSVANGQRYGCCWEDTNLPPLWPRPRYSTRRCRMTS